MVALHFVDVAAFQIVDEGVDEDLIHGHQFAEEVAMSVLYQGTKGVQQQQKTKRKRNTKTVAVAEEQLVVVGAAVFDDDDQNPSL